ncbi:MAG: sel1 repeat family protein [Bacteroidetes bacterium]|nr:sel1 repeat family protein [Bacteroidota bacterium]
MQQSSIKGILALMFLVLAFAECTSPSTETGEVDENKPLIESGDSGEAEAGEENKTKGVLQDAFMQAVICADPLSMECENEVTEMSGLSYQQLASTADFLLGQEEDVVVKGYKAFFTRKFEEAFLQFSYGADANDPIGQFNLAIMFEKGLGGREIDYLQASEWYRESATAGYTPAKYRLGLFYDYIWTDKLDHMRALSWYRQGAEAGDPKAKYCMGVMYRHGRGVNFNDDEAVELYRQAANEEYNLASAAIGVTNHISSPMLQPSNEVTAWVAEEAKKGNPQAQYIYGNMIEYGWSTPINLPEAARWYQRSADQNYSPAQLKVGLFYQQGEGLPKNDRKAAEWFQKAADLGIVQAQMNLAIMYAQGRGVVKDDAEAIRLFTAAANQEFPKAQYNLGFMYYKGMGVAKDDSQAGEWLRRAANNGHEGAQQILNELGYSY